MLNTVHIDHSSQLVPMLDAQLTTSFQHTVKGATPASIHDLRVATRRLRSLLRALRSQCNQSEYASARSELNHLADTVAPARDAYVCKRTGARLLADASGIPSKEAKACTAVLGAGSRVAMTALGWHLRDSEPSACLDSTEDLLHRLTPLSEGRELERLLQARAERLLRRVASDLRRKPGRSHRLHVLRIRIKDARYLEEMLPSRSKRDLALTRRLGQMQAVLGDILDMRKFQEWLSLAPLSDTTRRKLLSAAHTHEADLLDAYQRRRRRLRRTLHHRFAGA